MTDFGMTRFRAVPHPEHIATAAVFRMRHPLLSLPPDCEDTPNNRQSDKPIAGIDGEQLERAALVDALWQVGRGNEADPYDEADQSAPAKCRGIKSR